MKNACNDNEELSFITLSAATKNVTRWLELTEEKQEERNRETGSGGAEKQHADEHTEYVDQRLRELTAFERRVNGGRKS